MTGKSGSPMALAILPAALSLLLLGIGFLRPAFVFTAAKTRAVRELIGPHGLAVFFIVCGLFAGVVTYMILSNRMGK